MPHPALPPGPVKGVDVSVAPAGSDLLSFRYTLSGHPGGVKIPARRACVRADELWRHTCFEAFLKTPGESGYRELNFSPSGEWAAYRFDAYRAGMAVDPELEVPQLEIRAAADVLEMRAQVRLAGVLCAAPALAVALAVVVESIDGRFPTGRCGMLGPSLISTIPRASMLEIARCDSASIGCYPSRAAQAAGRPPRRTARASGVGDAAPDALTGCIGGAARTCASSRHSVRNTACAATSRTTWWSRRTSAIRCMASRCSACTADVRRPTQAMMDSFDVLLVDLQDVGCRIYTYVTTLRYVLEEAARAWQVSVGPGSPESHRPAHRGSQTARTAGRVSWVPAPCRCAMASRSGSSRGWFVRTLQPRCGLRGGADGGLEPARPRRVTAGRSASVVGESKPQRRESVDGAALCRHGHARGHDSVRRPRYYPPTRTVRRARAARARAARRMQRLAPAVAAWMPVASLLVRADLSQARRASSAPACRFMSRTALTTTAGFALAAVALALKARDVCGRTKHLWRRFSLRVREREGSTRH